jgi:hypothetical protein
MVEGDLLEDQTQSQRDLMEEEVAITPCKHKKKKGKLGVGPNIASTQEKTPSPIAQNKGGIETSVGSSVKKPFVAAKKNKGNEKVFHLNEKLLVHVHLHFFKESNIEGNSLLVLLNEPIRRKRAKGPHNVMKWTSFPRHKMKR